MITRIAPIGVVVLQMVSSVVWACKGQWKLSLLWFFVGMANVMVVSLGGTK